MFQQANLSISIMINIQQLPLYLQHSLDHINFSSLWRRMKQQRLILVCLNQLVLNLIRNQLKVGRVGRHIFYKIMRQKYDCNRSRSFFRIQNIFCIFWCIKITEFSCNVTHFLSDQVSIILFNIQYGISLTFVIT